jgi:Na+/H+-dicarboxylate symporter
VVQAWSKILNKKKAIHAYLVEIIIGFIPSDLCTYLMQTSSILHFYICFGVVLASITKKGEIEREIGLHLFLYEFWWLNCPTQINWTN